MDQAESPEIVDDFELGKEEAVDVKDKDVNKQKLKRRIDQYKVWDFDGIYMLMSQAYTTMCHHFVD